MKAHLDSLIGKSIDTICPNNFHSSSDNHCAHFVSHAIGISFSFNCVEFKGGSHTGANIRVHEVFSKCPKVGVWNGVDLSKDQLVFVTKKNNVNVQTKTMINIPQKHIGILSGGHVYHYSNTNEKVVKWTPEKFFSVFETAYSGEQALFWGSFPLHDLDLKVDPSGANVQMGLPFELEERDSRWFAKAMEGNDQEQFFVGKVVDNKPKKYHGLYLPVSEYYGPKYKAADYVDKFDHWANLLELTAYSESKGYINLINTYDRAKFTFGFYQLAAHTANDNLILLFRQLLGLKKSKDYFPELQMIDGALHRVNEDGGYTNLETVMATGSGGRKQLQLFMNYLNNWRVSVDKQEVLQAARLMHWTTNDPEFRELQVSVSNDILQSKMSRRYHKWYNLEGSSDVICGIIADIHHHGRAKRAIVETALAADDQVAALLTVNHHIYEDRNESLKVKVEEMIKDGRLGTHIYDPAINGFTSKPLEF
jgi:hypothetical protein